MKRRRALIIFAAVLVAAAVLFLKVIGWHSPKPHSLPPVVADTTEQLLASLQGALQTNAPALAKSLQPGLSDAQISALETQGGFHLSDDLRALYRWHNGMATNSIIGLLPGQRFLPLDYIVAQRAVESQRLASASPLQRAAFAAFAHSRDWVHVLDDGAGDGYFYDPKRTDADAAFFYFMAEEGYYVWFPSLRNFLSGVVEAYHTGTVKVAADGKSLDGDFDKLQKIWDRLGKASTS